MIESHRFGHNSPCLSLSLSLFLSLSLATCMDDRSGSCPAGGRPSVAATETAAAVTNFTAAEPKRSKSPEKRERVIAISLVARRGREGRRTRKKGGKKLSRSLVVCLKQAEFLKLRRAQNTEMPANSGLRLVNLLEEWGARSANSKLVPRKYCQQTVGPLSPLPIPRTIDTGDLWIFS